MQELNLCLNEISEIKGLDSLTNLKILRIYANRIEEIKGLENLKSLEILELGEAH
ncbi:MAG: leucine-rich repeat domain-containing protein [Promethearchaeota archaeon]